LSKTWDQQRTKNNVTHRIAVKMETGLPGVTQVLVIRPVEEVHVREKERAPTHPPLEMAKTAKEVIQNGSLATHSHVQLRSLRRQNLARNILMSVSSSIPPTA